MTFEQRSEGVTDADNQRVLEAEETASAKALRWEYAWCVGKKERRPVWLVWRNEGGRWYNNAIREAIMERSGKMV